MVYHIGIDEAGRGPVIGPMVVAGIIIEDKKEKEIEDLGAKDSKLVLPSKRRELSELFKKKFAYTIQELTPKEIDDGTNLNHLEAQKMAMVINELSQETDEEIVAFVDCPSISVRKWVEYLETFLIDRKRIKIVAEHKADAKYPVVSGASIIAKERREELIAELKKEFHVDFGSGYPSDPKTSLFIKENYNNPIFKDFIRHSWASVKRLHKKGEQERLF